MKNIKYRPINWTDGVKLSSAHFMHSHHASVEQHQCLAERLITPFNYGLWNPAASGYQRNYWDKFDHFKAKTVKVRIKRRALDKEYTSLSVRLPDEIPLGDWFDWFLQDQSKRTPHAPIEGAEGGADGREGGWIFYTSRWISYPLFIRVLDPKLTGEDNKVCKGQVIYAKRVSTK